MSLGNRKKQTTRLQFEAMCSAMKKNPDIAKNFTKKDPEFIQRFWEDLKGQLNSLGPPIKEIAEWKKVWSDHKSALRKKLAHNNRERRATGGGENNEVFFTPLEEEIIELVCLKDCAVGVPGTKSFGTPLIKNLPSCSTALMDVVSPPYNEENDQNFPNVSKDGEENDPKLNTKDVNIVIPSDNTENSARKAPKLQQLLQRQIHIQEKLCNKVSEVLERVNYQSEERNVNLKKIYRSLDRLLEHQKHENSVQERLLEEAERHNRQMEKLATEKLQYKKQALEIELKKINQSLNQ